MKTKFTLSAIAFLCARLAFAQCLDSTILLNLPFNGDAVDASPFTHSTSVSGAALTADMRGNANSAYVFSSTGHKITVPNHTAFSALNDGFTVSSWVYPTSFNQYNAIISKLTSSHRDFYLRYHNDGKVQFHYTKGSGGNNFCTTPNAVIALNQWHHVVTTWDGNDMKIYVNNDLKITQTFSEKPDMRTGNILVGSFGGGTERVTGTLDEIKIWDHAFDSIQINCLYKAGLTLQDSLLVHLQMDGNLADSSGNGFDATAPSAPVSTQGVYGVDSTAYDFVSANNNRIKIDNDPAFASMSTAFSIAAWIFPEDVSGYNVITSRVHNSTRELVFRIQAGGLLGAHHHHGGSLYFTSAPSGIITTNKWQLVHLTWDGTYMKIYVDGEEVKAVDHAANPPSFTNADWAIGALQTTGGEEFEGKMDEFKIWDRALTACEIANAYRPPVNLLSMDTIQLCGGDIDTLQTSNELGWCSVEWSDNENGSMKVLNSDSLGIGTHTIYVDAYDSIQHHYSDTVVVVVTELPMVSLTTNQTINGNDGSVDAMVSMGTVPYSYLWSDASTGSSATGLGAGVYTVTITDSQGCIAMSTDTVTACVVVVEDSLNGATCGQMNGWIAITPIAGFSPYTYVWSSGATTDTLVGLNGGAFTVTVTDSIGCKETFTYTLLQTDSISIDLDATNESSAGNDGQVNIDIAGGDSTYTFTWNTGSTDEDLMGLVAGNYIVTVVDGDGCTAIDSAVVIQCALSAIFTDSSATCGQNNGSITVSVVNGTGPFVYQWSNGENTTSISDLVPNTYYVTITDAQSCALLDSTMLLSSSDSLEIISTVIDETAPGASDGAIGLQITGGTSPYQYEWNTGSTAQNLNGLMGGNYLVTVTSFDGCLESLSITVGTGVGVGISSYSFAEINIYPNPATDMLILQLAAHLIGEKVRMVDAQGRTIESWIADESKQLLDLTQYQSGIYHLIIGQEKYSNTHRFVIR